MHKPIGKNKFRGIGRDEVIDKLSNSVADLEWLIEVEIPAILEKLKELKRKRRLTKKHKTTLYDIRGSLPEETFALHEQIDDLLK